MQKSFLCSRGVALDLETLQAGEFRPAAGGEFEWPIPYEEYAFLPGDMVDRVVAAGRQSAITAELDAVVESKLSDIVTDLSVIGRLGVDLHTIRKLDRKPLYDRTASRWMDFLQCGGTNAEAIARQQRWYFQKPSATVPLLKRGLRRWHSDFQALLAPNAGRLDVLSQNDLAQEYLVAGQHQMISISPNYWDWPVPAVASPEPGEAIDAMTGAFTSAMNRSIGDARTLAKSVRELARAVIAEHLAKAWADLDRVRKLLSDRRAGAVLLGGTPKHIGRLFAWRYKSLDRQVIRFAHGGERAFYDDYCWGLAELPFCDRYICHSGAEAKLLEKRRLEKRIAPAGYDSVEFTSCGSAKHQAMRFRSRSPRARDRSRTVMYIAGGYLGEALGDFPSRKPPDVLYFDWQVSLLKTLRQLGYRVVTKYHPQGILSEARLLAPFSDEVIGGYFDPEGHDVDCYLFDFAGTAFFDALAAEKGIVLLDMGIRPRDNSSFQDLAQRCEIVPCLLQEDNRFRVDEDLLGEAIEQASTAGHWPESFFTDYFGK